MDDVYPSAHVGDRLRAERERLGLRQEDAALVAGVTRAMWSRYERGEASPGSKVLLALVGQQFDLNFILGGAPVLTAATLDDHEEQVIANFRQTDDEGRWVIARTARTEADRVRNTRKP